MKAFYAHRLVIYNTKQEERDLKLLEDLGFEVLNPNQPVYQKMYKEKGMETSRYFIQKCDALAFRALPEGDIPAGVWKEIRIAKEFGKLVFELPSFAMRNKMDVEDTREYLREIRQR